MTTTTDSRIRADFGMDGSIATDQFSTADIKLRPLRGAQPTKPIDTSTTPAPDTSTTAGKISVLQHSASGGLIQMMTRGRSGTDVDDGWSESWNPGDNYNFNWDRYDYRIAPPPAARSWLQEAQDHARTFPKTLDSRSTEAKMSILLAHIDAAPILHIHGSGSQANIDWTKTDSRPLQPGRYRLVRDEA